MTRRIDEWLADVASDDEAVVVRALHQACPCSGSAVLYERYTAKLHELKKDPRPAVRQVALHLEEDALDQLKIQDEKANGYRRNRPGGAGRRGEIKRADIRDGVRTARQSKRRTTR